jgi:hypothetical protein
MWQLHLRDSPPLKVNSLKDDAPQFHRWGPGDWVIVIEANMSGKGKVLTQSLDKVT